MAHYFKNLKHLIISIILILTVVIEQIPYADYFNWQKSTHNSRINRFIKNNECDVIYYNFEKNQNYIINNLDVIWYANNNNKYCINDFSNFVSENKKIELYSKCSLKLKVNYE